MKCVHFLSHVLVTIQQSKCMTLHNSLGCVLYTNPVLQYLILNTKGPGLGFTFIKNINTSSM